MTVQNVVFLCVFFFFLCYHVKKISGWYHTTCNFYVVHTTYNFFRYFEHRHNNNFHAPCRVHDCYNSRTPGLMLDGAVTTLSLIAFIGPLTWKRPWISTHTVLLCLITACFGLTMRVYWDSLMFSIWIGILACSIIPSAFTSEF